MLSTVSLAILAAGPSLGASLPTKGRVAAPQQPVPYYQPEPVDQWAGSWNGFYLGLGVGTQIGLAEVSSPFGEGVFSLDSVGNWGFVGDVKAGYDFRVSNTPFVIGLFGGYSLGESEVKLTVGEFSGACSLAQTWNVGGRGGIVAWNSSLLYVGYKYQRADLDCSGQGTRDIGGHGILGGYEIPVTKSITLALEYSYVMMDETSFGQVNVDPEIHSVMLRGNVRFPGLFGQ